MPLALRHIIEHQRARKEPAVHGNPLHAAALIGRLHNQRFPIRREECALDHGRHFVRAAKVNHYRFRAVAVAIHRIGFDGLLPARANGEGVAGGIAFRKLPIEINPNEAGAAFVCCCHRYLVKIPAHRDIGNHRAADIPLHRFGEVARLVLRLRCDPLCAMLQKVIGDFIAEVEHIAHMDTLHPAAAFVRRRDRHMAVACADGQRSNSWRGLVGVGDVIALSAVFADIPVVVLGPYEDGLGAHRDIVGNRASGEELCFPVRRNIDTLDAGRALVRRCNDSLGVVRAELDAGDLRRADIVFLRRAAVAVVVLRLNEN